MLTPPIGVAYLAGSMRAAGQDVTVLDGLALGMDSYHPAPNQCQLVGLQLADLVDRIPDDVDIVGVSAAFSFEWPTCRELLAHIRRRFPRALLVCGGEHATALPSETLLDSVADVAVLGEGEETIIALAEAARSDRDVSEVRGIARKRDGKVIVNPRRPRMRGLDSIPWPAWDLLPVEAYLDRNAGFGVNRGRSMPLLASRGCPYQCTFCSSPNMWTTRWEARNPDLLLDEIQAYQEKYRATNFDFYDLTAIVKRSWIKDFCEKSIARGAEFTWQLPSGTRLEAIDREIAQLLFASGCRNLSFSPESGSRTVLRRIKKRIDPDRLVNTIAECSQAGLNIKCNLIFGFPGETYAEIAESYQLILRMALAGAHDLAIWAFSPYPGSELFEQMRASGEIVLDDAYYDSLRAYADTSNTVSRSEHIPSAILKTLRQVGQATFYGTAWGRHPWRPLRLLVNVGRGKHESRGEMVLANRLRRTGVASLLRQLRSSPDARVAEGLGRPFTVDASPTPAVPEDRGARPGPHDLH